MYNKVLAASKRSSRSKMRCIQRVEKKTLAEVEISNSRWEDLGTAWAHVVVAVVIVVLYFVVLVLHSRPRPPRALNSFWGAVWGPFVVPRMRSCVPLRFCFVVVVVVGAGRGFSKKRCYVMQHRVKILFLGTG